MLVARASLSGPTTIAPLNNVLITVLVLIAVLAATRMVNQLLANVRKDGKVQIAVSVSSEI